MFQKLIGDKKFYKTVLSLMIPIMVQNGITNFVNMLDNVMVGRLGTAPMSGVAVTNQLIFVFNLCVFGAVSGAGIFTAQFFGGHDDTGIRHTFRFKLISCTVISLCSIAIFYFFGTSLINLYLKGEGSAADIAATLGYAKRYLNIMLIGLLPHALTQCYSGTLRETGQPTVPMVSGIIAVVVNLGLNYVLIFGHLGAPRMGVAGAAAATVISRFAELGFIACWTAVHRAKAPFISGAFRSLYVPLSLVKKIIVKGLPLMVNETLFAAGLAAVNQSYSVRGLSVVAANNISQTFFNVFSVAFMAVGVSIGIILGHILGSQDSDAARAAAGKLIAFSVFVSVIVGCVYAVFAQFIPYLYNTNDAVRKTACAFMLVSAAAMPIDAFSNAAYFTLRSGGKVFLTMLFDSGYVWIIYVPAAYILTRFTGMPIVALYAVCHCLGLIKCVLGYIFVKKGIWIKKIV